jgi:DNA-directed RNA polymerase subunit H (RpoH/RPB5)
MDFSKMNELYYAKKHILELMEYNGYDISAHKSISLNELQIMYKQESLNFILTKMDNKEEQIYIYFYFNNKIKQNHIQNIVDDVFLSLLKPSDILYIVIIDDSIDSITTKLNELWEKENLFIVVEMMSQLQFNILKHEYVPQHIIIKEEEVKEVMIKYNMSSKEEFPKISRYDPVARAICMKPNEICKILRSSKSAIISEYYRICVIPS